MDSLNIVIMAVLAALFLVFNLFLFPAGFRGMKEKSLKPLDMMYGYSSAQVENLFNALETEGRIQYKKTLWTLDLVYPIIYTVLLVMIMFSFDDTIP